jgi:hypothetical protein
MVSVGAEAGGGGGCVPVDTVMSILSVSLTVYEWSRLPCSSEMLMSTASDMPVMSTTSMRVMKKCSILNIHLLNKVFIVL